MNNGSYGIREEERFVIIESRQTESAQGQRLWQSAYLLIAGDAPLSTNQVSVGRVAHESARHGHCPRYAALHSHSSRNKAASGPCE